LRYRDYDQIGLDAQYNNRVLVPDHAAYIDAWERRSAEARRHLSVDLDLAYGDDPRQRLDFFPAPQRDAPVLTFIHGGYWQALDKAHFSHVAPLFVAAGIAVAVLGYRLAPTQRMTAIAADIRAALAWLHRELPSLGGDRSRLHLAGHSAGGHLAALMAATDGPAVSAELPPGLVRGVCSISGLYDLEPIRLSYLNGTLALDAGEAAALSPMAQLPARASGPLLLAVGGSESAEYHRQQADYAAMLRAAKHPVQAMVLQGRHHFSAVDALAEPDSPLFEGVLRQILAPRF
jgi:arylformamidase